MFQSSEFSNGGLVMTNDKSRFESRNGVAGWEKHNAMIQAGYDTTDRMAALFGEITFAELFTQPWGTLVPRIMPKIESAASYGLIDDPSSVAELFNVFSAYYPEMSFKSLSDSMNGDDPILPKKAWASIFKLYQHHGIKLPEISENDGRNAEVKRTLDQLVDLAGDFTYRTIWETPRAKDLKAAMEAIQQAKPFVIFISSNHFCCSCGSSCHCNFASSTDYCGVAGGQCVIGSTICGGPTSIPY
jgi:hypothetical protein